MLQYFIGLGTVWITTLTRGTGIIATTYILDPLPSQPLSISLYHTLSLSLALSLSVMNIKIQFSVIQIPHFCAVGLFAHTECLLDYFI